jgi:hypothetical protein
VLIGDISAEALGIAAIVTDGAAGGGDLFIAGPAIDRDGKAVTRQAPRDYRPPGLASCPSPTRHAHASLPCGDDPTPGQAGTGTRWLAGHDVQAVRCGVARSAPQHCGDPARFTGRA